MQPLHPTADSVSIADILSACMLALPFPPFVVPAPRARTFYARSIPLGKIARASFAVLQQCFDLFFASWSSACCWRAAGVEENNDVSIVTSASVFPPIRLPHRTCKLCTYLALFPLCFVLRITTGASPKLCNLCTFSSLERNFSEALWFNSISSYLKNRILICFPSNSSNSCANWNVKSIFVSRFFFFLSLFCATLFLLRFVRHLCNQCLVSGRNFRWSSLIWTFLRIISGVLDCIDDVCSMRSPIWNRASCRCKWSIPAFSCESLKQKGGFGGYKGKTCFFLRCCDLRSTRDEFSLQVS